MVRYVLVSLLFFLAPVTNLIAQRYRPVDAASSVKVVIKNLGMATDGKLTGLSGSIVFNTADLKTSKFDVSVDARTINTDIPLRDSVLKGKNYLETDVNPTITLVSKQITQPNPGGPFQCKAVLHMKGIAKEIVLPFSVQAEKEGLRFTGSFTINRRDFKIAPGSDVLSEAMTIQLSVYAVKE
jgi:polyisoprenoid-binding protein YceI